MEDVIDEVELALSRLDRREGETTDSRRRATFVGEVDNKRGL